jgi:hypothetical protein
MDCAECKYYCQCESEFKLSEEICDEIINDRERDAADERWENERDALMENEYMRNFNYEMNV